ncbi:acyl-[acyl-carrier-protein]--UDP-N-acetylglucosamine O-acyltransferase [Proteobacteria bacterium CAG:495]|nr:acyl-[acyl-carrier-protein]--UDP-N-acetylglucosamine O-acyltransferase [Proteobacteria bacterium CAG:495]
MTDIHPTAVIEDGAQIAASAKIGPFCWISSRAKIGENVQLLGRVTIMGDTTVGEGTIVFPGACLGGGPQDHGNEFKEEAKLIIGKNNIIRENVTMHAGTPKEHFTTTVGDGGMFMINSHVAHDCVVGNNVIMTNNAVIGGHVRLGDGVIIGGNAAVHQFCRIGRKAMIGGLSGVDRDVIPFGIVTGDRGKLRGLNVIGLKRSGYDEGVVKSITKAFMFIFKGKEGTFEDRLVQAHEKFKDNEMIMEQVKFIDEALQGRRKIMVAE